MTNAKLTHVILKYEDNWSDEFDIYGFWVIEKNDYKEWKKNLNKCFPTNKIYFGTNEYMEYETKNCYLKTLTVLDITEETANVLIAVFGDVTWGNFIDPFDYYCEEEEDDD